MNTFACVQCPVIKDFELGVDLCYPENGKLRLPHTRPQTSPRSQASRTKSMARASTARYKVRLQTRTASPASLHSDSHAASALLTRTRRAMRRMRLRRSAIPLRPLAQLCVTTALPTQTTRAPTRQQRFAKSASAAVRPYSGCALNKKRKPSWTTERLQPKQDST